MPQTHMHRGSRGILYNRLRISGLGFRKSLGLRFRPLGLGLWCKVAQTSSLIRLSLINPQTWNPAQLGWWLRRLPLDWIFAWRTKFRFAFSIKVWSFGFLFAVSLPSYTCLSNKNFTEILGRVLRPKHPNPWLFLGLCFYKQSWLNADIGDLQD